MSEEKFPNIVLKKIIKKDVFETLLGSKRESICLNEIDELQFFQKDDEDIRYLPAEFVEIKISQANNQDLTQISPGEIVVALLDLKDFWENESPNSELEIYWKDEIARFGHYGKKNFIKMKLEKNLEKKGIEKKQIEDEEASEKLNEARDASYEFEGRID